VAALVRVDVAGEHQVYAVLVKQRFKSGLHGHRLPLEVVVVVARVKRAVAAHHDKRRFRPVGSVDNKKKGEWGRSRFLNLRGVFF
jgi:hypothetical protein